MTTISRTQQLGRAKNAMLDYFVKKLLVPKIYLDAQWNSVSVPVLAVDRAGVGDVHAVLFVERVNEFFAAPPATDDVKALDDVLAESIQRIETLPCQFRYVGVFNSDPGVAFYKPSPFIVERTLAADGVGRIGLLMLNITEAESTVKVAILPERFRSSKTIIELTDQYVAEHTADWEVRA